MDLSDLNGILTKGLPEAFSTLAVSKSQGNWYRKSVRKEQPERMLRGYTLS